MDIVVGVTGATGVIYAVKLLEATKNIKGLNTHLVMSEWAIKNLEIETEYNIDYVTSLANHTYNNKNMGAAIASGSFKVDGMVILPCSMKTLSSISIGYADNLISRAADVTIKEGRKLILCPRETPLSSIHLENMLKLSRLGVRIVPPMPGFYSNPKTIDDMVNHHVMKVLDQLGVTIHDELRWAGI